MPRFAQEDIKGNNGTHGSEGRALTVARTTVQRFGEGRVSGKISVPAGSCVFEDMVRERVKECPK
jgi:hypothetical protein